MTDLKSKQPNTVAATETGKAYCLRHHNMLKSMNTRVKGGKHASSDESVCSQQNNKQIALHDSSTSQTEQSTQCNLKMNIQGYSSKSDI